MSTQLQLLRLVDGQLQRGSARLRFIRKKQIFALVDVSDSMFELVGSGSLSGLARRPARSQDRGDWVNEIIDPLPAGVRPKIQLALQGLLDFADDACRSKAVGIAIFSTVARAMIAPTPRFPEVAAAIESIPENPICHGSTNLAAGLQLALDSIEPLESIMIVTDAKPDDKLAAISAANRIKSTGAEIIVICTEDADLDFVAQIRSAPRLSIQAQPVELRSAIRDAARLLKP